MNKRRENCEASARDALQTAWDLRTLVVPRVPDADLAPLALSFPPVLGPACFCPRARPATPAGQQCLLRALLSACAPGRASPAVCAALSRQRALRAAVAGGLTRYSALLLMVCAAQSECPSAVAAAASIVTDCRRIGGLLFKTACRVGPSGTLDMLADRPFNHGSLEATRSNSIALVEACEAGNVDVVLRLAQPPFSLGPEHARSRDCASLRVAAERGHASVVRALGQAPFCLGEADARPSPTPSPSPPADSPSRVPLERGDGARGGDRCAAGPGPRGAEIATATPGQSPPAAIGEAAAGSEQLSPRPEQQPRAVAPSDDDDDDDEAGDAAEEEAPRTEEQPVRPEVSDSSGSSSPEQRDEAKDAAPESPKPMRSALRRSSLKHSSSDADSPATAASSSGAPTPSESPASQKRVTFAPDTELEPSAKRPRREAASAAVRMWRAVMKSGGVRHRDGHIDGDGPPPPAPPRRPQRPRRSPKAQRAPRAQPEGAEEPSSDSGEDVKEEQQSDSESPEDGEHKDEGQEVKTEDGEEASGADDADAAMPSPRPPTPEPDSPPDDNENPTVVPSSETSSSDDNTEDDESAHHRLGLLPQRLRKDEARAPGAGPERRTRSGRKVRAPVGFEEFTSEDPDHPKTSPSVPQAPRLPEHPAAKRARTSETPRGSPQASHDAAAAVHAGPAPPRTRYRRSVPNGQVPRSMPITQLCCAQTTMPGMPGPTSSLLMGDQGSRILARQHHDHEGNLAAQKALETLLAQPRQEGGSQAADEQDPSRTESALLEEPAEELLMLMRQRPPEQELPRPVQPVPQTRSQFWGDSLTQSAGASLLDLPAANVLIQQQQRLQMVYSSKPQQLQPLQQQQSRQFFGGQVAQYAQQPIAPQRIAIKAQGPLQQQGALLTQLYGSPRVDPQRQVAQMHADASNSSFLLAGVVEQAAAKQPQPALHPAASSAAKWVQAASQATIVSEGAAEAQVAPAQPQDVAQADRNQQQQQQQQFFFSVPIQQLSAQRQQIIADFWGDSSATVHNGHNGQVHSQRLQSLAAAVDVVPPVGTLVQMIEKHAASQAQANSAVHQDAFLPKPMPDVRMVGAVGSTDVLQSFQRLTEAALLSGLDPAHTRKQQHEAIRQQRIQKQQEQQAKAPAPPQLHKAAQLPTQGSTMADSFARVNTLKLELARQNQERAELIARRMSLGQAIPQDGPHPEFEDTSAQAVQLLSQSPFGPRLSRTKARQRRSQRSQQHQHPHAPSAGLFEVPNAAATQVQRAAELALATVQQRAQALQPSPSSLLATVMLASQNQHRPQAQAPAPSVPRPLVAVDHCVPPAAPAPVGQAQLEQPGSPERPQLPARPVRKRRPVKRYESDDEDAEPMHDSSDDAWDGACAESDSKGGEESQMEEAAPAPAPRDAEPEMGSNEQAECPHFVAFSKHDLSGVELCTACSSGITDRDTAVFCIDCGEAYHVWCVELCKTAARASAASYWRCDNCKVCEVCYGCAAEGKLLVCDCCDKSYHSFCLRPELEEIPQGDWTCDSCQQSDLIAMRKAEKEAEEKQRSRRNPEVELPLMLPGSDMPDFITAEFQNPNLPRSRIVYRINLSLLRSAQASTTSSAEPPASDAPMRMEAEPFTPPSPAADRPMPCHGDDTRDCRLCNLRSYAGANRLLPVAPDEWAHANCLYWSRSCVVSEGGAVVNYSAILDEAANAICKLCGCPGASIGCSHAGCEVLYHLNCAIEDGASFLEHEDSARSVYCRLHRPADCAGMHAVASDLAQQRFLFVPGEFSQDLRVEKGGTLPVKLGALTVLSLGQGESHVGWSSVRIFWSIASPRQRTAYACEVHQGSCSVTARDTGERLEAATPTQLWAELVRRVNQGRCGEGLPGRVLQRSLRTGERFFGLLHPWVLAALGPAPKKAPGRRRRAISSTPPQAATPRPPPPPLPVNPTGCARAEGVALWHKIRQLGIPRGSCADDAVSLYAQGLLQHVVGAVGKTSGVRERELPVGMRYRKLVEMHKNLRVGKSPIQGLGVFAKVDIESETYLLEYMGEIIRQNLADIREERYRRMGIGDYMFSLGDGRVVDATMRGSWARYVNHSCEPNCYTQIISVAGQKHIIIVSKERIPAGTELSYDYKFPYEEEKVPCRCGAKRCHGTMN
eukprot:m51a1_g4190 putative trithorax- isoform d (2135) ;mRNA; f:392342-401491